MAGTQKMDGFWGNLKMHISEKRGIPHQHLPSYVREYQWRYSFPERVDGLSAFAGVLAHLVEAKKLKL